jgi:ribosomal protein L11 methyltransferase
MRKKISGCWLQLGLETNQHTAEQLEAALLQAGAVAVTLQDAGDQPVLEPSPGETPLWPVTRVIGMFHGKTDVAAVKRILGTLLGVDNLAECRVEVLADMDWTQIWLQHFRPMRFGSRLWIGPTNQTPPDPSAIPVFLDPGLTFGTGTHPTTALCLEWLAGTQLVDQNIIDYGCGSGILAIAAAKLGARRVWAVDIDPQALIASRQNARTNGVADRIVLSAPSRLPAFPADVLLANILASALIALSPQFARLVRTQGQLVLSGILTQQAEEVKAAFETWFNFSAEQQSEDWVLLHAVRKS